MLRPERKIYREELECDQCNRDCYLVTTHTLGGTQTEYEEDFLDTKLADLGIPALEILEARGQNGVSVYLELTGDVAQALSPAVSD
jgi:hypothetical protein